MAALLASSCSSITRTNPSSGSRSETLAPLSSSFLSPSLSSNSISSKSSFSLALPSSHASPLVARRLASRPLAVRAQRGTQLFKFGGGDKEGRGTIILRGRKGDKGKGGAEDTGKDGTRKLFRGGTRKIITDQKPEEVQVGPQGLFDGIAKLPFASLFLGRQADGKTAFVAGANGETGSRLVLQLLAAGFTVRAGVEEQSPDKLAQLADQYRQLIRPDDAKRLNVVQYSTSDPDFTTKAISSAGRVVVALGPGENGRGTMSPADALVLLQAAVQAKALSYVLVTSLGSSGGDNGGFFGAILGFLSSLGGGSTSFSDLLAAIVDSNVKYTVVRAGKTDLPDSVAESSAVVIAPEGKIGSGSISRVQVAQVVVEALAAGKNAEDKVFEAVTSQEASVSLSQQFLSIPVDGRRSSKQAARAKQEAEAKEREFREAAEAEARAVAAEAKAAAESLAALEAEARRMAAEETKVAAQQARAQAVAQAARESVSDLTKTLKAVAANAPSLPSPKGVIPSFASLVPDIPPPTPSSVAAAAQAAAAGLTRGGKAAAADKQQQRRPLKQRVQRPAPAPAPERPKAPPATPPKKEKILGGILGEQETLYMDPDVGDF